MRPLTAQTEYLENFQQLLDQAGDERMGLQEYLNGQIDRLTHLTQQISQETFWQVFPEILGIDAKLNLLTELIVFDDFTNEELLRIVETDYLTYFKELCGYDLKTNPKPSMIFQVL